MSTRLVLVSLLVLVACGKGDKDKPPPEPVPSTTDTAAAARAAPSGGGDAVAKAKQVFAQRCVPCHGATGTGDGPASASLDPKPRAFSDKAWQASITDEHIDKIIKFGGAAVGKSAAMPSNPDLSDAAVVTELRNLVRAFGK